MAVTQPTVEFADNADGTVTATITNATAGNTVTVYSQLADASLATPSWTSRGSRSGNGTVGPFAMSSGVYWGHAIATDGSSTLTSPLRFFGVMTASDPVHEQIIDAVVARLQSITFGGTTESPAANQAIYDTMIPVDLINRFPCLIVSLEGEPEVLGGVMNNTDDHVYGVHISIVDRNDDPTYKVSRSKYLAWKTKISRAFMSQRLTGVTPQAWATSIKAGPTVDPKLPEKEYFVTGLTVSFTVRQTRGIT